MNFLLCTRDGGTRHPLPAPLSFSFLDDADAPATQFTGRFPCPHTLPDLPWLRVLEYGREVFAGPLDVVQESMGSTAVCTIQARSPAALLLDSEALPGTYRDPDLGTLFRAHAAPYGFPGIAGDARSFPGAYTVAKGASEWTALDGFCRGYLGVPLREEGGNLLATKQAFPAPLVLGRGGLSYRQLCRTRSPYRLLSSVWGKGADGWTEAATDPDAAGRGILRRRLAGDPDAVLQKARQNAALATVLLPGHVPAAPGQPAVLCPQTGTTLEMSVTAVLWSLSDKGETTRISLRET